MLLYRKTALFFCPHHGQMHKCGSLLFGRETIEEIEEGDLIVLFYGFCLFTVADALSADDDGSAVAALGEGQHVVIGEAYLLSDLIRDGNSSSLAEDS